MSPYRSSVHCVRTKPSGHFLLMMGPRAAKMSSGNPEESAYTSSPCTPAIAAMFGYVNKIADPSAVGMKSVLSARSEGMGGEVAALGPASINLIDS